MKPFLTAMRLLVSAFVTLGVIAAGMHYLGGDDQVDLVGWFSRR